MDGDDNESDKNESSVAEEKSTTLQRRSSNEGPQIPNVIPPTTAAIDVLQQVSAVEPQNSKQRGSIWDTYIEMSDVADRKRRMTRQMSSVDNGNHTQQLADLGKIPHFCYISSQ